MEPVKAQPTGRLMPRDYAVLRDIGEHGFCSARWLKEHFSKGAPNFNHYRRLSILRSLGLIENLIGDGENKLAYRLTKKGIALLASQGVASAGPGYRASYRTTFRHDDYLVGLSKVFRSFPRITEYLPEHYVRQKLALKHGYQEKRRDGYKVPDALFTLKTSERSLRIAVELEIAPKAEGYYRRILRQLAISTDFDIVFVVVPNAKVERRIMSALAWMRANDPVFRFAKRNNGFYFALLENVLTNKGAAKFQGDGPAFTLAELAS